MDYTASVSIVTRCSSSENIVIKGKHLQIQFPILCMLNYTCHIIQELINNWLIN